MESAPIFEDSITGRSQEFRRGVAKFGALANRRCESVATRGAKCDRVNNFRYLEFTFLRLLWRLLWPSQ